jgi:hypothetical protein
VNIWRIRKAVPQSQPQHFRTDKAKFFNYFPFRKMRSFFALPIYPRSSALIGGHFSAAAHPLFSSQQNFQNLPPSYQPLTSNFSEPLHAPPLTMNPNGEHNQLIAEPTRNLSAGNARSLSS